MSEPFFMNAMYTYSEVFFPPLEGLALRPLPQLF